MYLGPDKMWVYSVGVSAGLALGVSPGLALGVSPTVPLSSALGVSASA